MKERVLISACLTGENCRYDGKNTLIKELMGLTKYYDLIPICPEVSGGLKTPRDPSEIKEDKVVSAHGRDVTQFYNDGAYWACSIARIYHIRLAILKEKSPSCGSHQIHNGNFDGGLVDGQGITTKKLTAMGVKVINEEEALALLNSLKQKNQQ